MLILNCFSIVAVSVVPVESWVKVSEVSVPNAVVSELKSDFVVWSIFFEVSDIEDPEVEAVVWFDCAKTVVSKEIVLLSIFGD